MLGIGLAIYSFEFSHICLLSFGDLLVMFPEDGSICLGAFHLVEASF